MIWKMMMTCQMFKKENNEDKIALPNFVLQFTQRKGKKHKSIYLLATVYMKSAK